MEELEQELDLDDSKEGGEKTATEEGDKFGKVELKAELNTKSTEGTHDSSKSTEDDEPSAEVKEGDADEGDKGPVSETEKAKLPGEGQTEQ